MHITLPTCSNHLIPRQTCHSEKGRRTHKNTGSLLFLYLHTVYSDGMHYHHGHLMLTSLPVSSHSRLCLVTTHLPLGNTPTSCRAVKRIPNRKVCVYVQHAACKATIILPHSLHLWSQGRTSGSSCLSCLSCILQPTRQQLEGCSLHSGVYSPAGKGTMTTPCLLGPLSSSGTQGQPVMQPAFLKARLSLHLSNRKEKPAVFQPTSLCSGCLCITHDSRDTHSIPMLPQLGYEAERHPKPSGITWQKHSDGGTHSKAAGMASPSQP